MLKTEQKTIKSCPFCGTTLADFPDVMIVRPYRSDEYLLEKLRHKQIIGPDAGYIVSCIQCGSSGGIGISKGEAIDKWNRRNLVGGKSD